MGESRTYRADERGGQDLPAVLLDDAFLRLHELTSRFPKTLEATFRDVEANWRRRIDEHGAESFFTGPLGTPAFQLLAWVAESVLDEPDGETARQASEAMLSWYFALRLQDDIVDEGAPAEGSFLQQALEAHVVGLLCQASGDSAQMLGLWTELVTDFAEAALEDVRIRGNYQSQWGEAELRLQGRKFLPMAAPLAALLIRAGKPAVIGPVRSAVETLSVGLQLTNDMLAASREVSSTERTAYLATLRFVPGLHEMADLTPALRRAIRRGDQARYVERTEQVLREARGLFDGLLSSQRMVRHVDERLDAFVERAQAMEFAALTSATPLMADVELTRRCNLSCSACYVRAQEPGRSLVEAAELPTDVAFDVLEELSGYMTTLHLTGGEPFLHPGVWEILEWAGSLGLDQVVINTNGVLLADGGLERLAETGLQVRLLVSVDGPPGTHDGSRGAGVEAKALDLLRRAPTLGVSATVASILTKELVDYGLHRWVGWLSEQVRETRPLGLWPLYSRSDVLLAEGCVGHSLDPAAMRSAVRQVAGLVAEEHDVAIADGPWLNAELRRQGVPEEKLVRCDAARGRLCVQADGVVSPCHPFRHPLDRIEPGRVGGFVARALECDDAVRLAAHDFEGCRECDDADVCSPCQGLVVTKGLALGGNDLLCRLDEDSALPLK